MRNRSKFATLILLSFLLLATLASIVVAYGPMRDGAASGGKHKAKTNAPSVYVCACLETKSCACMTEAKTEGPCACGTGGGPPMKAVAPDSDWAKQNRDALAK